MRLLCLFFFGLFGLGVCTPSFQILEPWPSFRIPCVRLQYFGTHDDRAACIPLRMQIECSFNTANPLTWVNLADNLTLPYSIVSQCWDPRCVARLGCRDQIATFMPETLASFHVSETPACDPFSPYMGTLPFSVTQQSCTKATLHVHIPIGTDVWVIPPDTLSPVPFVMSNGSLFVQPIDRAYLGNDTLQWRFLPLRDPFCLGWSVEVPMPEDCVKEQTLLTYVSSRVFLSYLAFTWTLLVVITATGTWFGTWVTHPWLGELVRVIGVYYQIPAFLSLGYSTLLFTTAAGFILSTIPIVLHCVWVLCISGKACMSHPTTVTRFGILAYLLYIAMFILSFAVST